MTSLQCLTLAALLLMGACTTMDTTAPDTPGAIPSQAGASLLVYRDRLCSGSAAMRQQWLSGLGDDADRGQQVQRLLLASCDPWDDRENLQQALQLVADNQDLSAEELAFVRLMQSQSSAQQETIRKVTDIENVIEQRPERERLDEEAQP